MDYLLQLRIAANACTKREIKRALKAVADRLDAALTQFTKNPSEANLIALNGAWATAARVHRTLPPEGDPAPLSGSPDAPELRKAA